MPATSAAHKNKTFLNAARDRKTLKRGVIVSAIVGSALILINQGDLIFAGAIPSLWKVALTYMVPFLVSVTSSAMAQSQIKDQNCSPTNLE